MTHNYYFLKFIKSAYFCTEAFVFRMMGVWVSVQIHVTLCDSFVQGSFALVQMEIIGKFFKTLISPDIKEALLPNIYPSKNKCYFHVRSFVLEDFPFSIKNNNCMYNKGDRCYNNWKWLCKIVHEQGL